MEESLEESKQKLEESQEQIKTNENGEHSVDCGLKSNPLPPPHTRKSLL